MTGTPDETFGALLRSYRQATSFTKKERATKLLREAESAARQAKDALTLATNPNFHAVVTQLQGDDARTAELFRESVGLSTALRDMWALGYGIVGLAGVAARQGHPEDAARLFGAAEALREKTGAVPSFPATQAPYEIDLAKVGTELDPETFDAAWAEGRAMTFEVAVAYALERTGDVTGV